MYWSSLEVDTKVMPPRDTGNISTKVSSWFGFFELLRITSDPSESTFLEEIVGA